MEEKKSKGNQVLLAVIGIATLLVAVIGATFAYFSARDVTGNRLENTVVAQTATYGALSVEYDPDYDDINTGLMDLTESDKGNDHKWLMKFKVTSAATTDLKMSISWIAVDNNFCQKVDGPITAATTACNNASGTENVSEELTYTLYSCNLAGYNGTTATSSATAHTVTIGSGCTVVDTADKPAPIEDATGMLHTAASLSIGTAAAGTNINYYAVVLTLKNTSTYQNYAQDKTFRGAVQVANVAN